jgi:hypothetical protein
LIPGLVRAFAVDRTLTEILGDDAYDEFSSSLGVDVGELVLTSYTY